MSISPREARVLVTGGRDEKNWQRIHKALDDMMIKLDEGAFPFEKFPAGPRPTRLTLIVGGAAGVDTFAAEWGHIQNKGRTFKRLQVIIEKADWKKYGKNAGPMRNQAMLDKHKPDLVVAFSGGSGTANMVGKAHRAGVRVIWIDQPSPIPVEVERARRAP